MGALQLQLLALALPVHALVVTSPPDIAGTYQHMEAAYGPSTDILKAKNGTTCEFTLQLAHPDKSACANLAPAPGIALLARRGGEWVGETQTGNPCSFAQKT